MGYYIARAGINMGYQVSYIHGPVPIKYRDISGAENVSVISTIDMLNAVMDRLDENTIVVMAAAPADYRPEKKFEYKLKKKENPEIKFIPNPDILVSIDQARKEKGIKSLILVGFAAELENPFEYAHGKLQRKNLDLIFLNDLSKPESGFGVDTNELTVIRKNGSSERWSVETKEKLGYMIVGEIEQWLE